MADPLTPGSIETVREVITVGRLKEIAATQFGDLVKAVVDLDRGIAAVGGELHSDEEAVLLADGSKQPALWGVNLYPDEFGEPGFLEFDSMINVRPSNGNRSRSVDDEQTRAAISELVGRLVVRDD